MRILVLNGGSSSFKFWLGEISGEPIPSAQPAPLWETSVDLTSASEIRAMLTPVLQRVPGPVDVVGHRIVNGGSAHRESTPLTPDVRAAIAQQIDVAPAHNRTQLAAIETVDSVLGGAVPQIGVFDTGFHSTINPSAYVYPGPYEWFEKGIRRFGFHGINYQYCARLAAELLGSNSHRLILCHLGNGASLAAVRDGKSVDTTMGFTPIEGLMMGTRSGSIDPGVLVYLLRTRGYTAAQLDQILNRESGLLGVSGISGDMREIVAAMESGNQRARLAFDIYAHRLCREIGAMLGVLGGADALVFTGGVGEHCAPLRDMVVKQFDFLKDLKVLVIHAGEEWEIARECYRLTETRTRH
jgi:acetate kinase